MTLLRPRLWGGHLLMVVALSAAIALGLWQYSAWQSHRAAAQSQAEKRPPVPLASLLTPDAPFANRALALQVAFVGEPLPNFWYVDRPLQGRDGYWVVAQVVVEGSVLPVVLGWSSTQTHPTVPSPLEVTGWLQPSETLEGPDATPSDNVYPQLRIASLTQSVDQDLYGGFVIAKTSPVRGLKTLQPANTPAATATTALRNLLYAIQWWCFGGFVIFIWLRWCRDELSAAEQESLDQESLDQESLGS